jgi:hypothetical protein
MLDRGVVKATSWPLYPPSRWKKPLPIVQEAGWAPGPVWTGAGNLTPPQESVKKQMTVIHQVGFELGTMSCYAITTRLSLRTLSLYFALTAHCTIPKPSLGLLTSRLPSVVFPVLASSVTKRHTIYITNRALEIDLDMLWAGLQPGIPV